MFPTREEIMSGDVRHKPEVIAKIRQWKRTEWYAARAIATEPAKSEAKATALRNLLTEIAAIYHKPVTTEWVPNAPNNGQYLGDGRIVLFGVPSIITALHELSHHLFGRSELKACRWSVRLFKKTFPVAFRELEWDGHMLVRRTTSMPFNPNAPSTELQEVIDLISSAPPEGGGEND